MSPITSHILDTACGRPAAGVPITLEIKTTETTWEIVGKSTTNEDGRAKDLLAKDTLKIGVYRITFDTTVYFQKKNEKTFYPYVAIVFEIKDVTQHYHVPLLISGFGYSTYRGS